MLTHLAPTARPTWSRLWLLLFGLLVAIGLAAFAGAPPGTDVVDVVDVPAITVPAAIVPIAVLAIAGIVGYAYSDRLLATKARATILILGLAAVSLLTYMVPVMAQAAESGVVRPTESTVITLDATVLSFLVGSVMPLLTAFATKLKASSRIKGVVNLVLSVLGGVLAAFVANSGSLTLIEIASAAIVVYLASGSTYSHLWKPTGVVDAVAGAPASGDYRAAPRASRGIG